MFYQNRWSVYLLKFKNSKSVSLLAITDHYYGRFANFQNINNNYKLNIQKSNFFWHNHPLNLSKELKLVNHYTLSGIFLKYLALSFTGKGHRLVFNDRKVTTFNFGHSHLYYVYFFELKMLQVTKLKFLFLGLNAFILKNITVKLYHTKPINIFTWRGVRYRKQILRKKTGKVSLYM